MVSEDYGMQEVDTINREDIDIATYLLAAAANLDVEHIRLTGPEAEAYKKEIEEKESLLYHNNKLKVEVI